MNNLSFRAYVKPDSKTVKKYAPQAAGHVFPVKELDLEFGYCKIDVGKFYRVEFKDSDLEIMQSTGLRDTKGKEIFEDDILRLYTAEAVIEDDPEDNLEAEYTDHVVVWGGDTYPAFDLNPNLGDGCNGLSSIVCGDAFVGYEVLGNKWENPKLMEKEPNSESTEDSC